MGHKNEYLLLSRPNSRVVQGLYGLPTRPATVCTVLNNQHVYVFCDYSCLYCYLLSIVLMPDWQFFGNTWYSSMQQVHRCTFVDLNFLFIFAYRFAICIPTVCTNAMPGDCTVVKIRTCAKSGAQVISQIYSCEFVGCLYISIILALIVFKDSLTLTLQLLMQKYR